MSRKSSNYRGMSALVEQTVKDIYSETGQPVTRLCLLKRIERMYPDSDKERLSTVVQSAVNYCKAQKKVEAVTRGLNSPLRPVFEPPASQYLPQIEVNKSVIENLTNESASQKEVTVSGTLVGAEVVDGKLRITVEVKELDY